MVDCSEYSPALIDQEARRRILAYLKNRGVRARELGVTSRYVSMVLNGERNLSDEALCRMLALLSHEEAQRLLAGIVPDKPATETDALKVVTRAVNDPSYRQFLLSLMGRFLSDYVSKSTAWHVTASDLAAFEQALRVAGLAEKTIRDEVRYVERALAALNWTLTPEGIRGFLANLEGYARKHASYALKSFLKRVLKPRDPAHFNAMYSAFPVYRPPPTGEARPLSIEEARAVFRAIPSIEVKAYFLVLAETGLRPGEALGIGIGSVDWEKGMIRVLKLRRTKKAFITFLRPETIDWLRANYLPRREELLKMVLPGMAAAGWASNHIESLKARLFPIDPRRARDTVASAARQAIGRPIKLYDLRKFFASWMIAHGVPETIVNTLQGRAPPAEYRVLIEHYWSPRHEELREWYLKHAPCILCNG